MSCAMVAITKTVASHVQVQVDRLLGYNRRIISDLSQSRSNYKPKYYNRQPIDCQRKSVS